MNTIEQYDRVLETVRELMIAKNADYGDSWRKMRLTSITDQILVKVDRVRSIEESSDAPKVSEGIESEYRDILNYCVFALIKMRESQEECNERNVKHLRGAEEIKGCMVRNRYGLNISRDMMRYRIIEFPSDEPARFVGVGALQWGDVVSGEIAEPTVGFVEADEED